MKTVEAACVGEELAMPLEKDVSLDQRRTQGGGVGTPPSASSLFLPIRLTEALVQAAPGC